jgi:ATP-dependent helicase HepA
MIFEHSGGVSGGGMGFVKVDKDVLSARGLGKVIQQRAGKVLLEFFDVPGRPCTTCWIEKSKVTQTALPPQTRVFVRSIDGRTWRVGRVLHGQGDSILIQLPNATAANVEVERVFVRSPGALAEPTDFLAQRINETPLFANARTEFVAAVTAQRTASLGMGAMLSSQIELNAYQFDVIRRVLQDPVQRYLLADEVGLGKTIEAGVVIRQYFIDDPAGARALVIAPRALVDQWRQELRERFALGCDIDADMLHVVAADDVAAIEEVIDDVGMLVVDEAHHLARADGEEGLLYDILETHAARVQRLLLLSATPALVDETGFLRMVHLLDPMTFPLDDVEGFRQRIARRQDVAEAVAALVPANMFILDRYLDRLGEAFPDDALLACHVKDLREVLANFPEETDEEFLDALATLKSHLSETYRLHRRILRNRRGAVPSWVTPRRKGLDRWRYECPATTSFAAAVETFRLAMTNSETEPDADEIQSLFSAALNPFDQNAWESVASWVRGRADLLLPFSELRQARERALNDGTRLERLRVGLAALMDERCKVVVFCGSRAAADQVYEYLHDAFGRTIERHEPGCGDEDGDEAEWRRFLSDPDCRILVCDQRAEEGLNLHGGRKVVVNFDVPASPNTLEQRLGRVDRYGAGDDITSYSLVCEGDPLQGAWLDCLDAGFNVFSQSIATLQYVIDDILRSLAAGWLSQGVVHVDNLTDELKGEEGRVRRELRRIDQQDALDALTGDANLTTFENLEEVDEQWQDFGKVIDGFLFHALRFQKKRVPFAQRLVDQDQVFRFEYAYDRAHETLVTLPDFVAYFLGEVDHEAPGANSRAPQSYIFTYRRYTALTSDGRRQRLRLLRYGSGLIDALTRFAERDDRGRVFAMWRYRPGVATENDQGVDLYFRFDFVIEASVQEASEASDRVTRRALRRVADGVMAPRFVQVWLDDQLRVVVEPRVELLEQYSKSREEDGARDVNLRPERWDEIERREFYVAEQWPKVCFRAREIAESTMRASAEFEDHVQSALKRMADMRRLKHGQMEARISRLHGAAREAEEAEYLRQLALDDRLEAAFAAPSVRLDTIGAIFFANIDPFTSAA